MDFLYKNDDEVSFSKLLMDSIWTEYKNIFNWIQLPNRTCQTATYQLPGQTFL